MSRVTNTISSANYIYICIALTLLAKPQEDSLQCVVGEGAGAEVVDVVETHQCPRAAGTRYGRQVAGGPTLGALPLVVLEEIVLCVLAMRHPLGGGAKQKQP